MYMAAWQGHEEVARLLLASNANVNQADEVSAVGKCGGMGRMCKRSCSSDIKSNGD